jgi:hypothetical protein
LIQRKIADLQKTIARVESPKGQKTWEACETAFILHSDGLLVTCAYVLNAAGIKPGQQVYLRFVVDGDTLYPAYVLKDGWKYEEDGDDIAFLKVDNLPNGALVAPLLE